MVGVVKWLGVGGSGGAIGLAARPEVRRSRIFTWLTDGVSEELEYARSNGEGRFFVRVFPTDLAVAAIYRCRLPPGSVLARPGLKKYVIVKAVGAMAQYLWFEDWAYIW